MRCDTLRCDARAADVVAVELGNPIKKLNRQSFVYPPLPNLFARCTIYTTYIYLTQLLSLHLSRAMWAQFKWLPVYELCILSRGELLRSKLKIIHSFFSIFLYSLFLSLSLCLLKGLWLL